MDLDRPLILRLLDTGSLALFSAMPFALLGFVLFCRPQDLPFRDPWIPVSAGFFVGFALILWRSSDVLVKIQRSMLLGALGYFLVFAIAPVMRHPVVAGKIAARLEAGAPFLGQLFREGAGMMALGVVGLFWATFCVVAFFFARLLRQETMAPPP